MDFLLLFLASYGICFGLMNGKAKILTSRLIRLQWLVQGDGEETPKTTFFMRMLTCPYCTGFHTGWIAWLLVRAPAFLPTTSGYFWEDLTAVTTEIIATSFASSALCYLLDTLAQWAEDTSSAASTVAERD